METKKFRGYWWISLVIGVLAIIAAGLVLTHPIISLAVLSSFFIAFFIISGISQLSLGISNGAGWLIFDGIINLLFGIFIFVLPPAQTILIFIYYVGFYILFQAFTGIWGAISIRKAGLSNSNLYLIASIIGVVIAFILLFQPQILSTFINLFFVIGLIIYGIYKIGYALQIKQS